MKKNSGAALTSVIVIFLLVTMIGVPLLSMVVYNYQLREYDSGIKEAEYKNEIVMDKIANIIKTEVIAAIAEAKNTSTADISAITDKLVNSYNSAYDNDEKVLHSTLSATRFTPIANTGHSLKVSCTEERINIINENYEVVASWLIDNLKAVMDRKLSDQFVFVRASSRGTGVNEEFLYEEAYLLDGFNSQSIIDLINEGQIFVDLRIGQYHSGPNRGKTHDHGTGFRIFERSHYLIFNIRRIA